MTAGSKVRRLAAVSSLVLNNAGTGNSAMAHTMGSVTLAEDDRLEVRCADGRLVRCEVLECGPSGALTRLRLGDRVLLLAPAEGDQMGVVLGRVRSYRTAESAAQVSIEASESLLLRCGNSSIDLRADGKVLIRGEDVLVRAKGTKRIRAGTVSIN